MAWYALTKWFRTFRKTSNYDAVRLYRHYLYDKWFNSLPSTLQLEELERQERIRKLKEQRNKEVMQEVQMMHQLVTGLGSPYADICAKIFQ